MGPLSALLHRYPNIPFLVDEAFIGLAGQSVAHLVPEYQNLLVTRTLSKAHSLAGFRVGYAVSPKPIAEERHILVKPLNDERLGPGYMRVTTALPEGNARFIAALRDLL